MHYNRSILSYSLDSNAINLWYYTSIIYINVSRLSRYIFFFFFVNTLRNSNSMVSLTTIANSSFYIDTKNAN